MLHYDLKRECQDTLSLYDRRYDHVCKPSSRYAATRILLMNVIATESISEWYINK